MTIKITLLIFVVSLILSHTVFAQEYTTVKPAFLKDRSDACSILHDNKTPNYDIRAFPVEYVSNHASNDLNSSYTRTTVVYYNDTNLIVTLSPDASKNNGSVYGNLDAPYIPHLYASNSQELTAQTFKKIKIEFSESKNFTLALTNIGNKTVTIIHPFADVLGVVTNFENGTSVQKFRIDKMQVSTMSEMPNFDTYELKPGQSLIQYYNSLHTPFDPSSSYMVPEPGNYTIASFARFLGDVNGTCSMVYLWSPTVDLVVDPENKTTAKIPEFPYAMTSILAIGLASLVAFSRIKNKI